MKNSILLAIALCSPALSSAQSIGRVIFSAPVNLQTAVPQQVCSNQQVEIQQPKTGAGAFFGAVAGALIGNTIGHGSGQAAATVLGSVGGAIAGDAIEQPSSQIQNVQNCTTQTTYENRTVYNVVYEFAGRRYSAQLPDAPGRTIPLQVTITDAGQQIVSPLVSSQAITATQPVYTQPTTVVVVPAQAPSPVYVAPYYPAVTFFGFGYCCGYHYYGGGHYHHWH